MDKVLHIIPDIHYVGNEDYSEKIESIPMEERDNACSWYLHGKLEERVGYDKAIITNCKTLGISKPSNASDGMTLNKLYFNGVADCKVEGIDEPCVGYFWVVNEYDDKNWRQKGLVCLKSDKEGCYYAEKKMSEKARII